MINVVTVEKIADAWEDGREGRFVFRRTGDLTDALEVEYTISGDATAEDDYEELSGTVEFVEGESEVEVTVTPVDDEDDDPGEVLTVTIDTSSEYEVGTADSADMMVVDDETQLVTVTKIADAFEGGANGMFRFTRTGDISSSLTVNYTVSGTATSGTDYTALSGSVTFAADEATADVMVALITDTSAESTETVIVSVDSGSTYGADPNAIDVVNVADDDTNSGIIGGGVWIDDEDGIWDSGEAAAESYSVTLRDADGNRIAETTTNSSGVYSFRGLTAGTYFVQFYAPQLYSFTEADQGSDESIDSDADTDTGWSEPISLTTGAMTNALVGAGFVRIPFPTLPDLSVIITDRLGSVLSSNQYLRVGKWENAFEKDPGDPEKPRVREQGEITGVAGVGFDFIDRDPDRFNILVKDLTAWGNETTNTPRITVKLSTLKADGTTVDDNPTVISLTRIPDRAGWYWSDSQLLVSNVTDDEYFNPKYLGKDNVDVAETTPAYKKGDFTFRVSDRTHKIALGGKVKAVYTKSGTDYPSATPSVKVEKSIKVHVTIMKNHADGAVNGTPAVTNAIVDEDIKALREIYTQAGIRVDVVGQYQTKDPPEGLDLSTGFDVTPGYGKATRDLDLTAKEKKLLPEFRTAPQDDIEVYYVPAMYTNGKREQVGQAYYFSGMKGMRVAGSKAWAHSVVLDGDHRTGKNGKPTGGAGPMVIAHEILHLLLDDGFHFGKDRIADPDTDNTDPTAVERVNTLVVNRHSLQTGTVIDSRRITQKQVEAMMALVEKLGLLLNPT